MSKAKATITIKSSWTDERAYQKEIAEGDIKKFLEAEAEYFDRVATVFSERAEEGEEVTAQIRIVLSK